MFDAAHIYGLDIETDTSGGYGLDPNRGGITSVAIATAERDIVIALGDGTESELLVALGYELDQLPDGLLGTWNGAVFDFPFIDCRLNRLGFGDASWGPVLTFQPGLKPKYEPTPGYEGGYAVNWVTSSGGGHTHLDISWAYKRHAERAGIKHSLKPVAKSLGIDMVEVDRENIHLLTEAEERAYVASDARGTRELVLRRLGLA